MHYRRIIQTVIFMKMKKFLASLLSVVAIVCCANFAACSDKDDSSSGGGQSAPTTANCTVEAISFDGVNSVDSIEKYYADTVIGSSSNDGPTENGMIISPYYSLKVGGVDVPVYGTRCGKGVHSFAMVNLKKIGDGNFEAKVELTALSSSAMKKKSPTAVVLPKKRNVEATIADGKLTSKVTDYGSFTIAFNKKSDEGLTLYVYEKEDFVLPEGYDKVEIQTGDHSYADTQFTNQNTVYVFKSGRHTIESVYIPSNAAVYLEDGAYLEVNPEGEGARKAAFTCPTGGSNIKLYGHGAVDFSACMGGDAKIKAAFNFQNATDITADGFVSINSNTWTVCFTNCENVLVSRLMVYGYRTYSDGIMLSDCRDSLVTKCFVRTGDDALETKSTSSNGYTDNVTFTDNDCWTDKGKAYGVIWECNHSTKNVYFIDNSVGFAQANWVERCGVLVVDIGDHYESVTNVYFKNIDIYRSYCPAVINCELKQKGKTIGDIYFENINCEYSEGWLLRLAEVEIENASSHFGQFYLDNVTMNGTLLTEQNKTDSSLTKYIIGSSWSPNKNVRVNTLSEEEE